MWVTARKEGQNLLSGQLSPALRGPSALTAAMGLAGKPTGVPQEGAPCKGSVSLRLEPWGRGPLTPLSSQAARGAVPRRPPSCGETPSPGCLALGLSPPPPAWCISGFSRSAERLGRNIPQVRERRWSPGAQGAMVGLIFNEDLNIDGQTDSPRT